MTCSRVGCGKPYTKRVMVFVPIKGDPDGDGVLIGDQLGIPLCAECAQRFDPKTLAFALPPLPVGVLDVSRAEKAIHEASWYEPGGKFFMGHG